MPQQRAVTVLLTSLIVSLLTTAATINGSEVNGVTNATSPLRRLVFDRYYASTLPPGAFRSSLSPFDNFMIFFRSTIIPSLRE